MHDPISRRQALGVFAAPLIAGIAGCRTDSLLSPSLGSAAVGEGFTLIGAGDPQPSQATTWHLRSRHETARMIRAVLDADPTAMAFNAGDLVQNGTAAEYRDCYHPTWGGFLDRTYCTMGNHDRMTNRGAEYYAYTGAEPYYARDLGAHWRLYVLNTESVSAGGADAAVQAEWMRQDIAAHPGKHRLLMCHYPLFSNVCATNQKAMVLPGKVGPWWQILQRNGGELVISGHAHRYERMAKALRDGTRSSEGMRQFVVGTGGIKTMGVLSRHPLYETATVAIGVVRYDLFPDRYQWTFTDTAGAIRDSGTQMCRNV
ncbi:MAG TPA: metallophosphoesterase [Gemmatimonadales bacterium]|nr:metallophosphoesterase [Gemmatimonadales bacterium]